jgi:hypothetical protein
MGIADGRQLSHEDQEVTGKIDPASILMRERQRETKSLLTFILLTLVAAAGGAIFIKWDRSRVLEREMRALPSAPSLAAPFEPVSPPSPSGAPSPP